MSFLRVQGQWKGSVGVYKDQEPSLGISLRYSSGGNMSAAEDVSLEFRGQI